MVIMVLFMIFFSLILLSGLYFTLRVNIEYRRAIKNGEITKEEVEKTREEMQIW